MKQHSLITAKTVVENLRHPIVRCAAAMMRYFDRDNFSCFYRYLDYYVSDASADFSHLIKQGIFIEKRSGSSYYSYVHSYYVNPVYLEKIIKDTPLSEIDKTMGIINYARNVVYDSVYDNKEDNYINFAQGLWRYTIGDDTYTKYLQNAKNELEQIEYVTASCLAVNIKTLVKNANYVPFWLALPDLPKARLRILLNDDFLRMKEIDPDNMLKSLFYDENNKPYDQHEALLYSLQNELFANGHIDSIIAKYSPDTEVGNYMRAIKAMLEQQYEPMIIATYELIKEYGESVMQVPALQFFFTAAVLASDNDKLLKDVDKMRRSRSMNGYAPMMQAVIEWRTKGKIGAKALEKLMSTAYGPAECLLFTILALHYNIYPDPTVRPEFMSFYIDNMVKSRMKYVYLMMAEEVEAYEHMIEPLQHETGMTSVLNAGGRKERWFMALEQIIKQINGFGTKNDNVNTERVAYLISPHNLHVQPILQKLSSTGKWSKGRNIALKTFRDGSVEGMSTQDRAVSTLVREEMTWSGVSYYILSYPALYRLAGHPYVFTDDDERLKIDIVEEPLQLSVQRDSKGQFEFNFNIDVNLVNYGFYVDDRNITSLRVVKLTEEQLQLIRQLKAVGTLPKRAESMLADTISALGQKMTVMSDLARSDNKAIEVAPSSTIIVQMMPDGDTIRTSLYVKPMADHPPYLAPGEGSEFVSIHVKHNMQQTKRNLKLEAENLQAVEKVLKPFINSQVDELTWQLSIEEALTVLNGINTIKDKAAVEWPEGVRMRVNRPQLQASDFHISLRKANDWFSVEGDVVIDKDTKIKISDVLHQLQNQSTRFVRLGDDEYVALSDDLARILRQIAQTADGNKHMKISKFDVFACQQLEDLGVEVAADRSYRQLMKRIEAAEKAQIKIPRGINAELREYQKEGYKWLARLNMWGAGACLADDMGLGKTLQTIVLLYAKRAEGPSLVVAPASVLINWQYEIQRFAPSLNAKVLNKGSESQRAETIANAAAGDVIITSYGLLVTKQKMIEAREWNIAVLDEAHTIKNRGTKMSKAAMTINAQMRVALTGTPLQNRLSEIWNIFQFINPGLLGSFQSFADRFITPIERDGNKERQRALKQLISPFLLRRTKNDVLNELPQKTEVTVRVNLSDEERALYEHMRQEAEMMVEQGGESAMQALAELTRLRQAACNPKLVNPKLEIESSKAAAFMQIVENLIDNDHRALVFSQFTSHLALIKPMLDEAGIPYLYLDGSTPPTERARLVDEFQNGDVPLFLISLKAGGLGLNLTGADYVIHLDPWWNPAIEDQASDRSYRIGQRKPVTVYRIIAADTIEEKILRLHQHKKSLADALLEGADMSARLTREDILNLLQRDTML